MFFANNYLTGNQINMLFLHNFFLDHEVIFCSHAMYFNAPQIIFTPIHLVTISI